MRRDGREVATTLRNTSVAEIEGGSTRCATHERRRSGQASLTHMAWVPDEWSRAAERVMRGHWATRVPSRTLLLHPEPGSGDDGSTRRSSIERFSGGGHGRQRRDRPDLAARERGRGAGERRRPAAAPRPAGLPPLARPAAFRPQAVRAADRRRRPADRRLPRMGPACRAGLRSWPTASTGSPCRIWRGPGCCRGEPRWPTAGPRSSARRGSRVVGPRADALLLAAWLETRLRRRFRLGHVDAEKVTRVEVDGEVVPPARGLPSSPGDLLSAELESFGRDSVYEAAVRAV